MCLTASPNLNAKYCREDMQESGRKVEATRSIRLHTLLWNKIVSERTSWYIDGLIQNLTVSHFYDSAPESEPYLLHYRSILI